MKVIKNFTEVFFSYDNKGSVIFSPGYPLGAFFKGSEKIPENLRGLKIFPLLALKGFKIL